MYLTIPFFLILLLLPTLNATVYDKNIYSKNYFYDTEFEEIVRFNPIKFSSDALSRESEEHLQEIIEMIKTYKDANKKILITIIGHTASTTDDANEKKLESHSYASKLQNYFSDSFDSNESLERSQSYAFKIQEYLQREGIDKNITMLELRSDKDGLYSIETEDGYELSNRVTISMYVEKDLDLDRDGVLSNVDNCPNSKLGAKVDENGCSYKTIVMLFESSKKYNVIEVTTKAGSSTIENSYDYTLVKSKNSIANVLTRMSDAEMKRVFGDVLVDSKSQFVKFTLYFKDKELLEDSKKKLLNIIDLISKSADAYIKVIGHTDSRGEKISNDLLAKERADLVTREIKSATSAYFYLVTESYGEYNLAVKTADEVREPLNKRVEIFIR